MKRQLYFDVLKGIAIFMVVMGHIITMCIRDIDQTPIFKFIGEIHMPLFFFISGWFAFKKLPEGGLAFPKIGARAKQLLVPMVVVSTLWIFYFPHSGLQSPLESTFGGLWLSASKNGYWFPLCLFEIVLVFAGLLPFLKRSERFVVDCAITFAGWCVILTLYYIFAKTELSPLLGLEFLFAYFPAFMIGFIASRYREGFERLIANNVFMVGVLVVGSVALYYASWWWELPDQTVLPEINLLRPITQMVLHVCLAFVAIAVFKPVVVRQCDRVGAGERLPRWIAVWSYVGVNSLGIYLLHYFFLFPLGFLQPSMLNVGLCFVPVLAVAGIAASAVIAVVLGLMRVIDVSPLISFLLTGSLSKK